MDQKIIKEAVSQAEKEAQQERVDRIKHIVKSYLEKIQNKSKERDKKKEELKELDEDIKLLKGDLEDLKSGRLDKIEERQEKDPRAKDLSIILIKKVEKEYIPVQPWFSPFIIIERQVPTISQIPSVWCGGDQNVVLTCSAIGAAQNMCGGTEWRTTGKQFSAFAGGVYEVDNKIINL